MIISYCRDQSDFNVSKHNTYFAALPKAKGRYESLSYSKSNAAHLTFLLWASYTLSCMVPTGSSLMLGSTSTDCGTAGYLPRISALDVGDRRPVAYGSLGRNRFAGIRPYLSNGSAWVVQYIQLTHAYISVTMIIEPSGIIAIPFIIGNRIKQNPAAFLYCSVGLAQLLTLIGANTSAADIYE
ncbi:sodium-dependent glucose transporter 1-like [Tropilaelaps mercedesae]|uniref:Sodium-dependent glucose transporter 1-like n=1 Tax=Tropilaelaps mercedesae TaxID=418985 RepID=A0A1V9XGA5_9ACAR|nr:sodium-dependent glucose transporter 1-like [Tropilaelaps mercedesae]